MHDHSGVNGVNGDVQPNGNTYDVEKIVGYRYNVTKRCNEYKVRWKGYDSSNDSWEDYKNLKSCTTKLREFYERIREHAGDPVPKRKDSGSESDDSDLAMTSDDDLPDRRHERVFPRIEDSGMALGWKPSKIIGWKSLEKPYTYLIQYKHKRQVEHLPVHYVARQYPKLVDEFHRAIDKPYPYGDLYE